MFKSKILIFLTFFLLVSTIFHDTAFSQGIPWWDDSWLYREEITLPIDTSQPHANFQPVDIRIMPKNPCWIKDEIIHSVRVCCWDGKRWEELESQIYDIEQKGQNIAKAFSLVFLIPENADGNEKYFLYYHEKEKSSTDYPNHVDVNVEHYFYEPMPGQNINLDYYKITDEEYCVFGVGIKGKMMTEYASNMIFSQKHGKKEFKVQNWDQLVGFCFQFDDEEGDVITTRQDLVSNEIIVDGNLMVELGIVSINGDKTAKTTNFYKYYHSPTDSKRICVDTRSEITNNIRIDVDIERDGTYVFLSEFKTRSESNTAMNMGEILPFFHIYSEDNKILEYSVETNPRAREEHRIIAIKDDIDLGENAWFSTDSGESGKAHGIIFSSNKDIIKTGAQEKDGLQIKAYEKEEASLPGLKAYSAGVYCGRNSYEEQGQWDSSIPSDLTIEFRGELFTTQTEGYSIIDSESQFFKKLVENRPLFDGTVEQKEEENLYNLTVFVPFSLSVPLIASLSPAPLPITWVELYNNDTLICAGATSRLLPGMRVELKGIPAGDYLLKVFKKLGEKCNYVGFKPVTIKKDTKTIVLCKRQVELSLVCSDQNNNRIENVEISVFSEDKYIEKNITDKTGKIVFKIPASKSYKLQSVYKGLVIDDEEIPLLLSKNLDIKADLHDLQVEIKDSFGLPPGVKVVPGLTSPDMLKKLTLTPEDISENKFLFSNLPAGTYIIRTFYEGFTDELQYIVPDDGEYAFLTFTPKFPFKLNIFDVRGSCISGRRVQLERGTEKIESKTDESGKVTIHVPPGSYMLLIYNGDSVIRETRVDITRDTEIYLTTEEEPTYPLLVTALAIIFIFLCVSLFVLKKIKLVTLIKLITIGLVIIALIQPWWNLYGESDDGKVKRFSHAYIIPQTIVTKTTSEDYIEAEPANLPKDFSDFVIVIVIVACFSILFFLFSMFIRKRRKICIGISILGVLLLVVSIAIFSYGLSEMTNIGLGSLQNSDTLNILNPATGESVDIFATWGLSYGFYLCVCAIIIFCIAIYLDITHKKYIRR